MHVRCSIHVLKKEQALAVRLRRQDNLFCFELAFSSQLQPFFCFLGVALHKLNWLRLVMRNTHQQMICIPVGLRLHTRKVIDAAFFIIPAIALAVKVHSEQLCNPLFIDSADIRIVAEPACIRVHQRISLRHIAKLLLINIAQLLIVIADAVLHHVIAFLREKAFVAHIIHQVMVIFAAHIRRYHRMLERRQLAQIIIIAVIAVDERQTIAIRAHLPEAVAFEVAQLFRH